MDLIGGGATNYQEMLNFLGKKRPFVGSPFQMNFPEKYDNKDMEPLSMKPKKCNDEDPNYRCVCVDCPAVCPTLPDVKDSKYCHVGVLPCRALSVDVAKSNVTVVSPATTALLQNQIASSGILRMTLRLKWMPACRRSTHLIRPSLLTQTYPTVLMLAATQPSFSEIRLSG